MTSAHIHIIKMGGTIEFIDPAYDAINNNLMKLDTSIDSYLERIIKPHFTFSTETITHKDSRDITETDRQNLLTAIQSTPHENIIVTHGTFTMADTAKFLASHNINKKVILTGSMIPITGFATSDAGFNLGFAIASLPSVKSDIYLCMNGGLFRSEEVEKNIDEFRFE
jgi:L-asparaginase